MWHMLDLPLKNPRLNPLDGGKVVTMLLSHLHKGTVMVGNGSKILGLTFLATEESFQLIQYVSDLFLVLSKNTSDMMLNIYWWSFEHVSNSWFCPQHHLLRLTKKQMNAIICLAYRKRGYNWHTRGRINFQLICEDTETSAYIEICIAEWLVQCYVQEFGQLNWYPAMQLNGTGRTLLHLVNW